MICSNAPQAETGQEKELPALGSLSIRRPSEIIAMPMDDSDCILGDRLLAKGQSLTILGAGGVGKSRLLLQLAGCCIVGRPFLGLETHGQNLRWLIIQAENSNRRLKSDFSRLAKWAGKGWQEIDRLLSIHTIETDLDSFLNLDNWENEARLRRMIETTSPDIIAFDPLNTFSFGDPNKDQDMRETCQAISNLSRIGNPARAIVVLHHALTGRSGAMKASGYDRASFGRNSKVLQAWTRGQINVAPASPEDNNHLVFVCGKCSNGKEFPRFSAKLNPATMIYESDPNFDFQNWESGLSAKNGSSPLVTSKLVSSLCENGSTKSDLVRAIMQETGCQKSRAYSAIEKAETQGELNFNKKTKTYETPY